MPAKINKKEVYLTKKDHNPTMGKYPGRKQLRTKERAQEKNPDNVVQCSRCLNYLSESFMTKPADIIITNNQSLNKKICKKCNKDVAKAVFIKEDIKATMLPADIYVPKKAEELSDTELESYWNFDDIPDCVTSEED